MNKRGGQEHQFLSSFHNQIVELKIGEEEQLEDHKEIEVELINKFEILLNEPIMDMLEVIIMNISHILNLVMPT